MSFVYLAVMWLAYGVLRASTDALSGTCALGSALGQSAQADCNPACFPLGANTIAYCSDSHDGFAQGTLAESAQGGCISSTDLSGCGCHAQRSNGVCSCGSSTMGRNYCFKSTTPCFGCSAGTAAPCGCSTPTGGCQGATSESQCTTCPDGTFKAGTSPMGCKRYWGGYDAIPPDNMPALSPGKNYSTPFT